jgi:hypothetical protein
MRVLAALCAASVLASAKMGRKRLPAVSPTPMEQLSLT